jgi:predicted nucleic acid-binding protein
VTADVALVDANVFIYYLTGVDEEKAERSLKLLRSLQRGEVEATTTDLVIAEVVWFLQRHKFTNDEIREKVLPLLQSPGIRLSNKQMWNRVFDIFCSDRVEFTDAHAAAVMEQTGMKIYSFDTGFDRIKTVERIEP